ncbi:MAG TPA: VanZ family protein [Terracidiphilus sp.]|nr:VanZ family protein [Terracidiphilus sp.]
MSNERDARFWIQAWWPVVIMAGLITISSSHSFGADETSGPLRWLWQHLFGPVSNPRWGFIHFCIRKIGHFVGYGTLGLTWLRAWRLSVPRFRILTDALLAVTGTALIASCDEIHQAFISNRTGSPWDVLLDCCGAVTMCVLAFGCMRIARQMKQSRLAVPLRTGR